MMCAKFGIIVIANNDLAMGGRDLWITLYTTIWYLVLIVQAQNQPFGLNPDILELTDFFYILW